MFGLKRAPDEIEQSADEPPADPHNHDEPAEAAEQLLELVTGGSLLGHNPPGQVEHLPHLVSRDGDCP